MPISEVVSVTITRESASVEQANFGTPLIAGVLPAGAVSAYGSDRVREYSALADLLDDGFADTDLEYVQAAAMFAQTPRPSTVKIGRLSSLVAQVDTITPTAVNDATYTVTITAYVSGVLTTTTITYTADGTATLAEVCTGIAAAINGSAQAPNVTAANVANTTVTVTSDVAGSGFTCTVGDNMTLAHTTANTGYSDGLDAIAAEDEDWYALVLDSRVAANIADAAAWVQSHDVRHVLVAQCNDAALLTSSTADIASKLQDAGYTRTLLVYYSDDAVALDAAWVGRCLPPAPGSLTWSLKSLVGPTADTLTTSQRGYLDAKAANHYTALGGVSVTRNGTVANGYFIDDVIGIDWIEARMGERVFARLVALDKVPFTDAGIALVEAEVRGTLEAAARAGIITRDSIVVTVPRASAVADADKAARLLPDITWSATLAGAVHRITINGKVAV